MKKLWGEFRSFAMGGNVFDLALGFLIGAAFAKLVGSLADNVLMQLLAAAFGQPDFTRWHFTVNGAMIHYGRFLTDVLGFLMLAGVLFLLVKVMTVIGVSRNRVFEERQCPYCMEPVAPTALVCKTCCRSLVAELPGVEAAERRAALLRERRRPRVPAIPVPAKLVRKRAAAPTLSTGSAISTGSEVATGIGYGDAGTATGGAAEGAAGRGLADDFLVQPLRPETDLGGGGSPEHSRDL